jgi:hypothetical protein
MMMSLLVFVWHFVSRNTMRWWVLLALLLLAYQVLYELPAPSFVVHQQGLTRRVALPSE